tara:strand:- start:890 stop:1165 length:276 start_codon:yes stop_codon:yes gene_type:complete
MIIWEIDGNSFFHFLYIVYGGLVDKINFDGKSIPLSEAISEFVSGNLDEEEAVELLQEIVDSGFINKTPKSMKSKIDNYIRFGLIDEKKAS